MSKEQNKYFCVASKSNDFCNIINKQKTGYPYKKLTKQDQNYLKYIYQNLNNFWILKNPINKEIYLMDNIKPIVIMKYNENTGIIYDKIQYDFILNLIPFNILDDLNVRYKLTNGFFDYINLLCKSENLIGCTDIVIKNYTPLNLRNQNILVIESGNINFLQTGICKSNNINYTYFKGSLNTKQIIVKNSIHKFNIASNNVSILNDGELAEFNSLYGKSDFLLYVKNTLTPHKSVHDKVYWINKDRSLKHTFIISKLGTIKQKDSVKGSFLKYQFIINELLYKLSNSIVTLKV